MNDYTEALSPFKKNELKEYYKQVCLPHYDSMTVDYLRSGKISICYSDDMSFLSSAKVIDNVINEIIISSKTIKLFHATRANCVSTYFENGIMGQCKENLIMHARELFHDVSLQIFEQAISNIGRDHEEGAIWLTTNIKQLIRNAGHYLIRGSEYVQCLAVQIDILMGREREYFNRLKYFGIPTVFEVHYPISKLKDSDLNEIARMAISYCANTIIGNNEKPEYICGAKIVGGVENKYIISHNHPMVIADPHEQMRKYKSSKRKCNYCKKQKVG